MKSIVNIRSVHFCQVDGDASRLEVILNTSDGMFVLGFNRIKRLKHPDALRDYSLFMPFESHRAMLGATSIDLAQIKCAEDGDLYLLLSDGSVISRVSILHDHSDPNSSADILRFDRSGEVDPRHLDYISALQPVQIECDERSK